MSGNVTLAKLLVRIGADSSEFSRQMYKTEKRFQSSAANFRKIGNSLTYGVTLPMVAVGGAALKMAMDAEESENLFQVSMGSMADSARKFSENMADGLGLSGHAIRKQVATLNVMLGSMGLSEQAAYDMSTSFTKLAYDMASFYDLPVEEAFEKLQAGITGEAEPLKRLGILVNENTIKQAAWASGIAETGEALTESQKVQARYQTIMAQTVKAQGDLARTSDSSTNQLRSLKEQAKETAIQFGNALLPFLQSAMPVFKDLSEFARRAAEAFAAMDPETRKLAVGIAASLAAAGPASRVFGGMFSVLGGGAKMLRLASKEARALTAATTAASAATAGLTTAQRLSGDQMKIAAGQANTLKVMLAAGVGVATYALTTALLEHTEAGKKFNESLKDSADVSKEYADALTKNKSTYQEQILLYTKMRVALGLTGEEWRITTLHTEDNAKKLAYMMPKVLQMNRELVNQASAQRQANAATASGRDWSARMSTELAKQAKVLEHITDQTKDMYDVMSQRDAEEAMAALVADFKLLAKEGISSEQMMEAFGSKVQDLAGVADDYAGIKFPKHFEDLAYAVNTKAIYSIEALAGRLSRELPDAATAAQASLEGTIGQGMEKASEKVKVEADKMQQYLTALKDGNWQIDVNIDMNSDAFRRQLAELGLQPDTAGALP